MSVEAMRWALHVQPGAGWVTERMGDDKRRLRVPAIQRKLVLLVLAWHASTGPHGEARVWPSQRTLADETGLSRRAVQRTLESLTEDMWVGRVVRPNRSALYILMLGRDAPEQVP